MWDVFKVFLRLMWRRDSDSAVHLCIVLDRLLTQHDRLQVSDLFRSSHVYHSLSRSGNPDVPEPSD